MPRNALHVSDRTMLVCRDCLLLWPIRAAVALRKTRNQLIPIGGRGKRGCLLVAYPNGAHAPVRCPSHDVLNGTSCQAKEDLDALSLHCLRYQCAPLDASHATPPLVRCRLLCPAPALLPCPLL